MGSYFKHTDLQGLPKHRQDFSPTKIRDNPSPSVGTAQAAKNYPCAKNQSLSEEDLDDYIGTRIF